jgi:hypothetical protein
VEELFSPLTLEFSFFISSFLNSLSKISYTLTFRETKFIKVGIKHIFQESDKINILGREGKPIVSPIDNLVDNPKLFRNT